MTTIFLNKKLHKSFCRLEDGIEEFYLLKRAFPLKTIKLFWNGTPQKRYCYEPPQDLIDYHKSRVKRLLAQQPVGTFPAYYQPSGGTAISNGALPAT